LKKRNSTLAQQPFLTRFIAGWRVPGLGHLLGGKIREGWLLILSLNCLWAIGMWLSNFEGASRLFHPYLFWTGAGCGGTAILSFFDPAADLALSGLSSVQDYQDVPYWNDTGLLLVFVAGLLNILCLLDLIDSRIEPNRHQSSSPGKDSPR